MGAKRASHVVSLVTNVVAATVLAVMTTRNAKYRTGETFWAKHGASVAVWVSIPLVAADPTRHVLQDAGLWTGASSFMYRSSCEHADVRCLSVTGFTFLMFTYVGFACMLGGVLVSTGAARKLSSGWRRIRRGE